MTTDDTVFKSELFGILVGIFSAFDGIGNVLVALTIIPTFAVDKGLSEGDDFVEVVATRVVGNEREILDNACVDEINLVLVEFSVATLLLMVDIPVVCKLPVNLCEIIVGAVEVCVELVSINSLGAAT